MPTRTTSTPICVRSTRRAARASWCRRCPQMSVGTRCAIGCGAPRRPRPRPFPWMTTTPSRRASCPERRTAIADIATPRAASRRGQAIDPFLPEQIRRLVREFGSPLLIIDCERVRTQYRKLQQALPGVALHYALKPLPHAAVVRVIAELGCSMDPATTGEVQLVQSLGIDPARCIHSHPIKRERDIRNALE